MPPFFFFSSPPSFFRLDAVTNADNLYGRTALHWAAEEGHLTTIDLLLRSGAEINTKGKTPSTVV
jgi:ankyrin repeat protein